MDKLLFAARMTSIGDEIKQNDTDLISDIERLINIVNQCVEIMEDFILEFHVSPANILQSKLKDVKQLKFAVIYNGKYTGLELMEKKKECTELLRAAIEDEFEGIEGIRKIEYELLNNWEYPTLTLYSMLPTPILSTFEHIDWTVLKDICNDGFCVSIPNSFQYQKVKTLFVHCYSVKDYSVLVGTMLNSERQYRMRIYESSEFGKHSTGWAYIPIVGLEPIRYDIPYQFISSKDFM